MFISDLWQKNWQPTCADNQEVFKIAIPERDNFKQPLLGSSCDDKFCPKGTACVQQEFFAHCCGKYLRIQNDIVSLLHTQC